MTLALFIAVLIAETLLFAILLWSMARPARRIWPPPRRNSWQFWTTWSLTAFGYSGGFSVGVLDWNSFRLMHWWRFAVGGALSAIGLWLVCWGVVSLGMRGSAGLKHELVTGGAYRYSRHPQYVGFVALFAGYILITNSVDMLVIGGLGTVWYLLAPCAEEPWVREQYGAVYEEYQQCVPRFLGRRSFRPIA